MPINQETLKPNLFTSYFETLKQDSQEIITRKSLIHQPTKLCVEAEEIHQNPTTNEVTMLVKKKFDQRLGSMIEQTTFDYQSGISTTEIWSSSSGAKEPLSTTQKKII
jgi:hypothetical protein